jgi:DNA primase
MIPNEIIDQILDKTDIVEVISAYAPLKKSGQNFKARCPFHEEKTASFMVSPGKQIYHCFGCGAGGNVISFLMKHERMDFIEAIGILAEKTGVALPRSGREGRGENTLADKLYGANNVACGLYQENLTKNTDGEAYRYFVQRGISERIAKLFRLGFAADSWQGLINHCAPKKLEPDILERAGLVLKHPQTGNRYDRFRNRIVFPIFDLRNRVLGFGARAMDNSLPKYVNSPETYIYKKGTNLYGLNFAKEHIRKQNYVIIVEGYFDLILPYQHEIKNIAATLGTALTPEQIGRLRRFTKNAIMVYDSDKAGEEATLRSLDLLIQEDMNVRIAILPKGADPDSFVRKAGKGGFMKILKESKDLFDYKLGVLTERFRKDDPRGKARIVGGMLPTLAKIKNAVLKSAYLKKMSEELSIDEESVRAELKKTKPNFARDYFAGARKPASTGEKSGNLAEIALLAIALEDTDSLKRIEEELGLSSIKNESIICILKKMSELRGNGKKITPSRLISCFEGDGNEGIISEAVSMSQNIHDKKRVLEDCFKHIKKYNLKETLSSMRFRIKDAENSADAATINRLVAEYNELIKSGLRIKD